MKSFKKLSFITAIFALFITFSVSTAFVEGEQEEIPKVQPETFTVEGTVTDWKTGDPLANAQVIVVDNEDLNTLTDAEGKFIIESLAPGTYTIKIKLEGYQTWEKDVQVTADKQLEIMLKPVIK